jgi:hypothetical protein
MLCREDRRRLDFDAARALRDGPVERVHDVMWKRGRQ